MWLATSFVVFASVSLIDGERIEIGLSHVEHQPTLESLRNTNVGRHATSRSRRGDDDEGGTDFDAVDKPSYTAALQGYPFSTYHLKLAFGEKETQLSVVIDTGSSNLAVTGPKTEVPGVGVSYDPNSSNTCTQTNRMFEVKYVTGEIKGNMVSDIVKFPKLDNIGTRTTFGVMTWTNDFFLPNSSYQGILGLGYPSLSAGGDTPFFDNLVHTGKVENVFGLQLCDAYFRNGSRDKRSAMVLGSSPTNISNGKTIYYGKMYYTPITEEKYYNVRVQGMSVDGNTIDIPCGTYNSPGPSLIDSGTSLVYLPTKAHAALMDVIGPRIIGTLPTWVQENVTEKKLFLDGETCRFARGSALASLPPISLHFPMDGDPTKQFAVDILPLHYMHLEYKGGYACYSMAIRPWCIEASGANIGMIFMNNVYAEFDRDNRRIGLASSICAANGRRVDTVREIPQSVPGGEPLDSCKPLSSIRCEPLPDLTGVYFTWGAAAFSLVLLLYSLYVWSRTFFCKKKPPTETNTSTRKSCSMLLCCKPSSTTVTISDLADNDDDDVLLDDF